MNKGKLIDVDKLKEIICKYYNPKLYEHIFKIIDELSEEREQPNPLKVATKGDGTDKYAVLLFNYFYEYCVKCRLMVDDFIPELYYHIENDKVVYCPHLPEGYTEISLKNNKPTGLIPELEKRVEVIEQKLKDLSNG